ncbi:MAG TPA: PIN domain-containing protein [Chloroflexota bacterium]|nr:PIN domain-containing protein [Chloroflexota bacterium]
MGTRCHRAQVLLEPEQHHELTEMARRQKRSVSEVIRRLVDEAIARQRADAENKYRQWLDLRALGVELVPMTADHARSALRWAARVRQSRAHDGFYLAVAEELGTELWTADQRLANAAQAAGAGWAHWIGEPS